jgi:folylpolyglutamate synthase
MQKTFAEKWKELDPSSLAVINVLTSVEDAFEYVRNLSGRNSVDGEEGKKIHAFITGSVHLVGRALGALEGVDVL